MVTRTAVVVGILLALGAASAVASPRAPKLLDNTAAAIFGVRPATMVFDESNYRGGTFNYMYGPGVRARAVHGGKPGHIRWEEWGATAIGRATSLTQKCSSLDAVIQSCSEHYIALQVTIKAWRVRRGRYTRVVFTFDSPPYASGYTYGLRRIREYGVSTVSWCAVNNHATCWHP